jgi:hypothetical protein
LPRDRTGDQIPSGESVAGELPVMVEFVERVEMRAYDFQDELERIRRLWAAEDAAAVRRPRPSAGFHRPRTSRFS